MGQDASGAKVDDARAKVVQLLKSRKGRIALSPPTNATIEIPDTRTIKRDMKNLTVTATGLFPSSLKDFNWIGATFGKWFGFDPKVSFI